MGGAFLIEAPSVRVIADGKASLAPIDDGRIGIVDDIRLRDEAIGPVLQPRGDRKADLRPDGNLADDDLRPQALVAGILRRVPYGRILGQRPDGILARDPPRTGRQTVTHRLAVGEHAPLEIGHDRTVDRHATQIKRRSVRPDTDHRHERENEKKDFHTAYYKRNPPSAASHQRGIGRIRQERRLTGR